MINIDEFSTTISESSSKGNQRKFYHNDYWIKLDNDRCNEGLAEEFVSKFENLILDFNMNNIIKAVLSDRLAYYYNKGVYEFV